MDTKKSLREKVLRKRDVLTKEEHREKSICIAEYVIGYSAFKKADVILLFDSFRNEVDTAKIFESAIAFGKEVYYPKVLGKEMEFYRVESQEDFEDGRWGIREPKVAEARKFIPKKEESICVIMPGAVFDKSGNRIGYGGGYYDKFLEKMKNFSIYKVGIGFDCQVVEIDEFPAEEHDVTLDILVTESEIYVCK